MAKAKTKKPAGAKATARKPAAKGGAKSAAKPGKAKSSGAKAPAAKRSSDGRVTNVTNVTNGANGHPSAAAGAGAPPFPPDWLADGAGREKAFDALGHWFAAAVLAAPDDATAREVMRVGVERFSDIRESAGQPGGEYAGHFFMVDAVGLADSDRPVPFNVIRDAAPDREDHLLAIFEDVLSEAVNADL